MRPRTPDECCANCPAFDSEGHCRINGPILIDAAGEAWWPMPHKTEWCIPGIKLMREEKP